MRPYLKGIKSSRIPLLMATLVLFSLLAGSAIADHQTSSSLQTSEVVEGAVFSVPESLEDEIQQYRDRNPVADNTHAFILAKQDQLYLVFSNQEPSKGLATVSGRIFRTNLQANGLSFSVMTAESISVETRGAETSVNQLSSNPSEHALDLVRVTASHRQVTSVTDPDQGQNVTAATSTGVLVENPSTASSLLDQPGSRAQSLSINSSTDMLGSNTQSETSSLLGSNQPRVYTFNFETAFWRDHEATVDGIVLTPGSQARKFASRFDQGGFTKAANGRSILYVVDSEVDTQTYDSVSSLQQQASIGDRVSVRTNMYGQTISVQETLEQSTPCGPSKAQIPSPSGPICVDIIQDTVIHSGVAWSSLPHSEEDTLLVVGLSSRHSDTPIASLQGEYQLTGKVVSTSQISSELSQGKALFVTDFNQVKSSSSTGSSSESQSVIQERLASLNSTLQQQIYRTKEGTNMDQSETEEWPSFGYNAANTGYSPNSAGPKKSVEIERRYSPELVPNESLASGPAVYGDELYVGSEVMNENYDVISGNMYAFNTETKDLKWRSQTEGGISSTPTVKRGIIYVTTKDQQSDSANGWEGYVYAFDANTGDIRWKFETENLVTSSATVKNGQVYVTDWDGTVYALEADSGSLQWSYTSRNRFSDIKSSPAVNDGTVFVGFEEPAQVVALDANSGDISWRKKTKAPVQAAPAVQNGHVYATASSDNHGYVYSFDSETGSLEWEIKTEPLDLSPSVSNGTLYTGSFFNTAGLYAIDTSSGNIEWSNNQSAAAKPVIGSNRVYTSGLSLVKSFDKEGEVDIHTSSFNSVGSIAIANTKLYITNESSIMRISEVNSSVSSESNQVSTDTPEPTTMLESTPEPIERSDQSLLSRLGELLRSLFWLLPGGFTLSLSVVTVLGAYLVLKGLAIYLGY